MPAPTKVVLALLCVAFATPLLAQSALAQSTLAQSGLPPELQPQRPNGGAKPSICQAVAAPLEPQWRVEHASFTATERLAEGHSTNGTLAPDEVAIRFDNHSTYVIRTAAGVRIATDFNGYLHGDGTADSRLPPTVATMNRAHSSHYTNNPDPAIQHVMPGWANELGGAPPAEHYAEVEDVVVRNVTTDILRWGHQPDGNSIFVFEVAGLCIGHLGHLHHEPRESHYAALGRLDVVMVPVDGGLTLSHDGMKRVLDRLRSRVVLPMHLRSFNALPDFLAMMSDLRVSRPREAELVLSMRTLPAEPTVVILPNLD